MDNLDDDISDESDEEPTINLDDLLGTSAGRHASNSNPNRTFKIHVEKLYMHSKVDKTLDSFNKLYVCHFCEKIFLRRKHIIKHLKIHERRKFSCKFCHKKFSSMATVHNHRQQKHRILAEPIVCEECGQSFTQKTSLNKHMKIHLNIRDYQCYFCAQTFVHQATLRTHIERHKGVVYKCDICGKQYTSRQNLRGHLEKHLGLAALKPKPSLKCDQCFMEFTSKHLLNVSNRGLLPSALPCHILFPIFYIF
ncbi:hypothetical protein WDU94_000097 [Cyamophila willieti]